MQNIKKDKKTLAILAIELLKKRHELEAKEKAVKEEIVRQSRILNKIKSL